MKFEEGEEGGGRLHSHIFKRLVRQWRCLELSDDAGWVLVFTKLDLCLDSGDPKVEREYTREFPSPN